MVDTFIANASADEYDPSLYCSGSLLNLVIVFGASFETFSQLVLQD